MRITAVLFPPQKVNEDQTRTPETSLDSCSKQYIWIPPLDTPISASFGWSILDWCGKCAIREVCAASVHRLQMSSRCCCTALSVHRARSRLQPVIILSYWQKILFYIKMLLRPSVSTGPSIQMHCEFQCVQVSDLKLRLKLCQHTAKGVSSCGLWSVKKDWMHGQTVWGLWGCLGSSLGYKSHFEPFEAPLTSSVIVTCLCLSFICQQKKGAAHILCEVICSKRFDSRQHTLPSFLFHASVLIFQSGTVGSSWCATMIIWLPAFFRNAEICAVTSLKMA